MPRMFAFSTILLISITTAFAQDQSESDTSGLAPLVTLLGQVDDAAFQLDLLKGIQQGLAGRRNVDMPKDWPGVYKKLAKSKNAEVREKATALAVIFGDPAALDAFRKTLMDAEAKIADRQSAIGVLRDKKDKQLPALLHQLLDKPDKAALKLRPLALRTLGSYNHKNTPAVILKQYERFSDPEKADALTTLASRSAYAAALLDAIATKKVPGKDVTTMTARQIVGLGDKTLTEKLKKVWGEIRPTSKVKAELMVKYKKSLNPKVLKKANLSSGRVVYQKTCGQCHKLYGQGGAVGPELTGSNRNNLDYLLENILDPSASVGKDYQMQLIETTDGQSLQGLIIASNEDAITVKTLNDSIVVPRDEILEQRQLPISMMPEGILQPLAEQQVRDLIAYLMHPGQVALPPGADKPGK